MAGKQSDEVKTAESSESVSNASGANTASKAQTAKSRAGASIQPPVQGFGAVKFDNQSSNPNERFSVAEDPDGEKNAKLHEKATSSKKGKS
jgi:hypothetical protein